MGVVSTDHVLTGDWAIENGEQPGLFGLMSREASQAVTVEMGGPNVGSETIVLEHAGDACSFPLKGVSRVTVSAPSYPAHVLVNFTNAPIVLTGAPILAPDTPAAPATFAAVLTAGADTGGGHVTDGFGDSFAFGSDETGKAADAVTGGFAHANGTHNASAFDLAQVDGTGEAFAGSQAIATAAGGSANGSFGATVLAGSGDAHSGIDVEGVDGDIKAWIRTYTDGSGPAEAFVAAQQTSQGTGSVTAQLFAANGASGAGGVTLGIHAPDAVTNPALQVNNLPLFTTAASAPGGSFVSLFYLDSTAVSGRLYLWDFVAGAYVAIAQQP